MATMSAASNNGDQKLSNTCTKYDIMHKNHGIGYVSRHLHKSTWNRHLLKVHGIGYVSRHLHKSTWNRHLMEICSFD